MRPEPNLSTDTHMAIRKPLSSAIVEAIKADGAAGLPTKRIQARIYIRYDRRLPVSDIAKIIREGLPSAADAQPSPRGVRVLMLEIADPGDYVNRPGFANIWATMHNAGAVPGDPWYIMRSRFEVGGERCYRIVPPANEVFAFWCSDSDFAGKMLGRGIVISIQPSLFGAKRWAA